MLHLDKWPLYIADQCSAKQDGVQKIKPLFDDFGIAF